MKILFVAPANSMHSFKWINYFQETGCNIYFVSLYKPENKLLEQYKQLSPICPGQTKIRLLNFIVTWIYTIYLIIKVRPDIIHGHTAGSHGLLASLCASRRLVTTVWGSDILFAAQKSYIKPFVKFLLRRSRIITCDANHMINALLKLKVPQKKICLINFGVDTNKLNKRRDEDLRFKAEYRGMENYKVVISLRNHWPVYDIETLIYAASQLLKKRSDVNFIIAGSGPETSSYIELGKKLQISERLKFVGSYSGSDIPDMFSACDIYVSCSLSDAGIAASTAEAMACCLPVVVSATGENDLWISDFENGMLFPKKNVNILADKLLLLLNDEPLASKIGSAGRLTIVEKNDYRNEMNKVLALYSKIIF